jgi:hypothetical protein
MKVPIKVVWQETTQFETVIELDIPQGQSRTKGGRRELREMVDAAIDDLGPKEQAEAFDTEYAGSRHIVDLKPIWDAVEVEPDGS